MFVEADHVVKMWHVNDSLQGQSTIFSLFSSFILVIGNFGNFISNLWMFINPLKFIYSPFKELKIVF